MNTQQYILALVKSNIREFRLYSEDDSPDWDDFQFVRSCALRYARGDENAWTDFNVRLVECPQLAYATFLLLLDASVLYEDPVTNSLDISVENGVEKLCLDDRKEFVSRLQLGSEPLQKRYSFVRQSADKQLRKYGIRPEPKDGFIDPQKRPKKSEILYIENKSSTEQPRVGRATRSSTRRTIYYAGRKLQSLSGQGFSANYFDVESGEQFWISGCKKDGTDSLSATNVTIDDDAREEYWTTVRGMTDRKSETSFRSPGSRQKRS